MKLAALLLLVLAPGATERATAAEESFGVGGREHPFETVRSELIETPLGPVRITELAVRRAAHADVGALTVTYLDPRDPVSGVEIEYPHIVEIGSNGRMAAWHIADRFSAWPVIVAEGGGTWQGQTCLWTTITELGPDGPVELLTFQQSMSTDGFPDGKPVDIASEIVSVERDRGFTVRFSGTRNFEANYLREGDKYVLQGGDDRALQGC